MRSRLVIKELKKKNGLWRLDWFGPLSINDNVRTDPYIEIAFSCIKDKDALRFRNSNLVKDSQQTATIGIGQLPLLHIGSLWEFGENIDSLNENVASLFEFTIHAPEKPVFLCAGQHIKKNYYDLNNFSQEDSIICSAIDSKQRIIELIIPCNEIFRFYYATSTQIAQELIYGAAYDLDKLVMFESTEEPKKRTWVGEDDTLFVTLRKRIPDSDAWTIARLLGNKFALKQAQKMYDSLLVSNSNKRQIQISFPFSGESQISCQGKWVVDQQDKFRFLVLRLKTCSFPFPYKKIYRKRENDGRTGTEKQGTIESNWTNITQKGSRNKELIEVHSIEEPSNTSQELQLEVNEDKFPDLKNKEVVVEEKLVSKYYANQNKIKGFEGLYHGTGQGTWGKTNTEKLKVKTNITDSEDENEKKIRIHPYFNEILEALIQYQPKEKSDFFTWSVIDLDNKVHKKSLVLSKFPKPKHSRSAWAYINPPEPTQRRALWIEIIIRNQHYYIVEWERRENSIENFGIYILARELRYIQAGYAEMALVMEKWADSQKYRSSDGLRRFRWYRGYIRHPLIDKHEKVNKLAKLILAGIKRLEREILKDLQKNS